MSRPLERWAPSIKPEHVDAWLNPDPWGSTPISLVSDSRVAVRFRNAVDAGYESLSALQKHW
jgi:hypothetical protein